MRICEQQDSYEGFHQFNMSKDAWKCPGVPLALLEFAIGMCDSDANALELKIV